MRIDTLQVHMYVALMYLKFDRIACFMYVRIVNYFQLERKRTEKKYFLSMNIVILGYLFEF